jgi:AcrR family transcriptional regulator
MTGPEQAPATPPRERILCEVLRRLETGGPNAVVLREVARGARVSLRDVYRHFGSRDELVVAAMAEWMDANVYRPLAEPVAEVALFDAMMRQFRHIFEPWERNPRMLESFVYARSTATGGELFRQGEEAAAPTFLPIIAPLEPEYAADLMLIVTNTVYALMGQIAAGQVPITEIMPTIERVLRRLTVCTEVPLRD